MKDETIAKVNADLAEWEMPAVEDWHGFVWHKSDKVIDDRREIFTCDNEDKHLRVTAYFHEETREYKLKIKVGLNELVRIEFIAPDIARFTERLETYFAKLLAELSNIDATPMPTLLREKGLAKWNCQDLLPRELNGFSLFISPRAPFPVANGSYIIIDYTNFELNTNFTIYFNIFRDEFFGESRIAGLPTVTYDFDAKNLPQLEMTLIGKLKGHLQKIDEMARQEATT